MRRWLTVERIPGEKGRPGRRTLEFRRRERTPDGARGAVQRPARLHRSFFGFEILGPVLSFLQISAVPGHRPPPPHPDPSEQKPRRGNFHCEETKPMTTGRSSQEVVRCGEMVGLAVVLVSNCSVRCRSIHPSRPFLWCLPLAQVPKWNLMCIKSRAAEVRVDSFGSQRGSPSRPSFRTSVLHYTESSFFKRLPCQVP